MVFPDARILEALMLQSTGREYVVYSEVESTTIINHYQNIPLKSKTII